MMSNRSSQDCCSIDRPFILNSCHHTYSPPQVWHSTRSPRSRDAAASRTAMVVWSSSPCRCVCVRMCRDSARNRSSWKTVWIGVRGREAAAQRGGNKSRRGLRQEVLRCKKKKKIRRFESFMRTIHGESYKDTRRSWTNSFADISQSIY